ncbi:MAG: aminoglycoside phosphotransferase family protein [Chloroflexi bacterium]|nr:MAG: hypothetical protein CUN54_07555 [Phototrophicales bacterium]RMF79416.1 MAG: aminoglycoside phosphotransferase family protein [Chloroflexota bacterium]
MDVSGTPNIKTTSEWPFSHSQLLAGLRQYYHDRLLRLEKIHIVHLASTDMTLSFGEAGTRLHHLIIEMTIDGDDASETFILKEPPVTNNGRVLSAVGQREYGIYRWLTPHLPIEVPRLVLGDAYDGWLVMEYLPDLPAPEAWQAENYYTAITNLVTLHDRFWGGSEHFNIYGWLARPLGADYTTTAIAAAQAVYRLIMNDHLTPLSRVDLYQMFSHLIQSADDIVAPLRHETQTLLHGDYWPGNIGCMSNNRQVIFDWQLASIGPSILDFVGFIQTVQLYTDPALSVEAMIAFYREELQQCALANWDDESFTHLWDHALMWLFTMNWIGKLAVMPLDNYTSIHERFWRVWIEPVQQAAERWL